MKKAQRKGNIKNIETSSLVIKKNIMMCGNTMIQLSNIAYISTEEIPDRPIPIGLYLIFLASALSSTISRYVSLSLMIIALVWGLYWNYENMQNYYKRLLTIHMNYGKTLYFEISDLVFLEHVLTILRCSISDESGREVSINVKDCKFSGDTQILNGIQL